MTKDLRIFTINDLLSLARIGSIMVHVEHQLGIPLILNVLIPKRLFVLLDLHGQLSLTQHVIHCATVVNGVDFAGLDRHGEVWDDWLG